MSNCCTQIRRLQYRPGMLYGKHVSGLYTIGNINRSGCTVYEPNTNSPQYWALGTTWPSHTQKRKVRSLNGSLKRSTETSGTFPPHFLGVNYLKRLQLLKIVEILMKISLSKCTCAFYHESTFPYYFYLVISVACNHDGYVRHVIWNLYYICSM